MRKRKAKTERWSAEQAHGELALWKDSGRCRDSAGNGDITRNGAGALPPFLLGATSQRWLGVTSSYADPPCVGWMLAKDARGAQR